jgi:hypothetical protein
MPAHPALVPDINPAVRTFQHATRWFEIQYQTVRDWQESQDGVRTLVQDKWWSDRPGEVVRLTKPPPRQPRRQARGQDQRIVIKWSDGSEYEVYRSDVSVLRRAALWDHMAAAAAKLNEVSSSAFLPEKIPVLVTAEPVMSAIQGAAESNGLLRLLLKHTEGERHHEAFDAEIVQELIEFKWQR